MATHATISVFDDSDKFDLYRHHDGYPQGSHGVIQDVKIAMARAWSMPEFQAGDFSASLVAIMKSCPGSVYLSRQADLHMGRQFHYDITSSNKTIQVCVHEYSERVGNIVPIFNGTIDKALEHFKIFPPKDTPKPDDPWAALAMAELALADIDASKRKGYLSKAKKLVFTTMDSKRLANSQNNELGNIHPKI